MRALQSTNRSLALVADVAEPTRSDGEVKVQVHYAAVNPTDADVARGDLDLYFRLYRVKSPIRTGLEFSGTVIEGGAQFSVGTKVFGYTHLIKGPKTHQDVLSISEDYIAEMPEEMNFAQAAAFPLGAQTSLVALGDVAKLQPQQSLLILGASGGLGVYAIQLAKSMRATVTGVSGPDGLDTMRKLGADMVINYCDMPLTEIKGTFDTVLDLSNRYTFQEVCHLLSPFGIFIPADPIKNLLSIAASPFRRKKTGYLLVEHGDNKLLTDLAKQVSNGTLKVGPFQEFEFEDFETAFASLKAPGHPGRTVLKLR